MIDSELTPMGVRLPTNYGWGATTTHMWSIVIFESKQSDQCFFPILVLALSVIDGSIRLWLCSPTYTKKTIITDGLLLVHH